jgi:hypothetical protein
VRVFIEVSAYMCMSIYICIIFFKKLIFCTYFFMIFTPTNNVFTYFTHLFLQKEVYMNSLDADVVSVMQSRFG